MHTCKNEECFEEIPDHRKYCSFKCRNIYVNRHIRDYTKNVKTANELSDHKKNAYELDPSKCVYCGEIIPYNKRINKFCNHSCSAAYINTKRDRKKYEISEDGLKTIRNANQNKHLILVEAYQKNPKYCQICGSVLEYEKRTRKTCSDKCLKNLITFNSKSNPNCGGETNRKKFKYKGICMDSSWEVTLAHWMDENNIEWKRDKNIWFEWIDEFNQKHRYHPDFYLPIIDLYVDPKNNYLIKQDKFKLEYVKRYHNLNLIFGEVENIIIEIKKLLNLKKEAVL